MVNDYRNTKYCPSLGEIRNKKNEVKTAILMAHSKAKDMHTFVSKNDSSFKKSFVEAYNGKCAYCGVSTDIISWKMLEVDHFIPKDSKRFEGSKAAAGYIENLVLSCYDCNRAKKAFELPDSENHKIHPDSEEIISSFIRDDNYYIQIQEKMIEDLTVNKFYKQLNLGSQIHRIDYLLMSMIGLRRKLSDKHSAYSKLGDTIIALQKKRNVIK